MPSYDRWLQVGAAFLVSGGSGALYMLQKSPKVSFWSVIGIASAAIIGIALFMLLVGSVMSNKKQIIETDQKILAEEASKRIGVKVRGRGRVRMENASISNQDIAFDVGDDGHLDAPDTDIE